MIVDLGIQERYGKGGPVYCNPNGIQIKPEEGRTLEHVDSITFAENCIIIIERPIRSEKQKRSAVNSLIDALWKTKKARNKHRLRKGRK